MGRRAERFYLQANALQTTDSMAESLIRAHAGVPPRYPDQFLTLVAERPDLLASMPYAFTLGTLPSSGGSEAFKQSLHDTIGARIERYPVLKAVQNPSVAT